MGRPRLDNLITRREREYAAADAAEDQERHAAAKRRAESCGRRLEKYSDSFEAFGEEPPLPIAGEYPGDYRRRLLRRVTDRAHPRHRWDRTRAADFASDSIGQVEAEVLEAARLDNRRQACPDDRDLQAHVGADHRR
jgi:hypothetical protein